MRPQTPKYAKLCGVDDGEAEDVLVDRVALTSYGGGDDFLCDSGSNTYAYAADAPTFTSYILAATASALLLKPACCAIFINYYLRAGDARFAIAGAGATGIYYLQLAYTGYFMYVNVRADLLPLRPAQQVFLGLLGFGRAAVFLITVYAAVSGWPRFFSRVAFRHGPDPSVILSGDVAAAEADARAYRSLLSATALLVIGLAVYGADLCCDILGFCLPRLWLAVGLKTRPAT